MTSPSLVLHVPLMDQDHARIEALLAQVPGAADQDLPRLLREIEVETVGHFDREEALMRLEGVPVLHCHIAQHRIILSALAEGHRAIEMGDMPALRRFLSVELAGAITAHIGSADRVTASFLKGEISTEDLDRLRLPDPT